MHRRKLRKYRVLKDICLLIGGTAFLALIGIVGGYESGTMDALMFLMELVIAVETMAVSYMAYRCVRCREHRYLRIRELRKRKWQQEMKKSA
ncbi:hypothetical protein H6A32_13220 [Drancourtella massiliensis]|uniref:Uncharacterized protein n=1 Tax=Drancourtella massiliensis TaxID=1632013 RepID=A0ABS2EJT5_9FIRM|nr:hypothetical protein [Drancourtella massiliensis]MBM6745245.1 hypothetical protein [Drancourtella massiliensis]